MPELPEVRAHAERLDGRLAGATLDRLEALSFTALKTADPPPEALAGRRLDAVTQRGKYLLLTFDDLTAVVHLMQGGRLRPDPKRAARPRNGLVRFRFEGDEALLLSEAGREHRAGVWVIAGDPLDDEPLDRLGPEADAVDAPTLLGLLRVDRQRLHNWLRDQRHLAGIGRRLANEVCWRARVSPFASTARLDAADAEVLVAAIGEAIEEGLADERRRDEMSSSAQRPGGVHGRVGQPCPRCGDVVREVSYSGYTVAYCATEQTGGKVLADNTTSRFLK